MTYKPIDTAIVMVVGPCIDDTDFKTLEEAIAYDAAGMDVSLIVEKTDGTTAVTAITLTTVGTSDWTHKDGGYYEIEITAAQNAEEGIAYVRGVCIGVLPFESIHYNVVKANVYDSWIKGTDVIQTDVTQWLGTAAATPAVAGVPEVDLTHIVGSVASTSIAQLGVNLVSEDNIDFGSTKKASIDARTLPSADYFDHNNDSVTLATTAIDAILDEVIGDAVHATPNSVGAMLHAIYCRYMQKRSASTSAEVAYKLDDTTPLKTFTYSDDGTVITRS